MYAGYQYDSETGLYYVNARYYDSTTGRFITEDTYAGKYCDPLSLNRYTYCHNNPLRYTAPSGHGFFSFIVKVVVGAAVGAVVEVVDQVFVQDKDWDEVDWGEVGYEAAVGAVSAGTSGIYGGSVGNGACSQLEQE